MSVAQKCLCLSSLRSILLPFQPALATTQTPFCFPSILPVACLLLPSSSRFYFLVFQLLFYPVVSILMSPCIHPVFPNVVYVQSNSHIVLLSLILLIWSVILLLLTRTGHLMPKYTSYLFSSPLVIFQGSHP